MISGLSADAEIYKNLPLCRQKCRALDGGEEPNEYFRRFFTDLENGVIGSEGIVLQMKIVETADRVVYSADEKAFLLNYESEMTERRAKITKRLRKRYPELDIPNPEPVRVLHDRAGNATVLRGQPDIYACNLVESGWSEFRKAINCTVTRQIEFHDVERLALRGTARDGEMILRKVKGFKNDFGFALQLIDPEWLDISLNSKQENGNQCVMGVEFNEWREPVAFHIIKRKDAQWLWGSNVGYGSSLPGSSRTRIDASEIIHVFLRERVDQSRGVPWLSSVIGRLKMLGKYEEAELIASMGAACKGGQYTNSFDPSADLPPGFEVDKESGEFVERMLPGQNIINKWGWKYETIDPRHPNGDYEEFRKGVLRGVAAGMPGSTYYGISQDLEAVNFSSMQGGDREAREAYMMMQNWFIRELHGKIFPEFLEAGLISGKIPLPISKFEKFNKPSWHGRRWRAIDPIKDVTSKALAVENGFTSRQRVIAEMTGDDYEAIMLELAYEDDFEESLGLVFAGELKAAQAAQIYAQSDGTDAGEEAAQGKIAKLFNGNGKKHPLSESRI
jgi:lambda family phage portal protein